MRETAANATARLLRGGEAYDLHSETIVTSPMF